MSDSEIKLPRFEDVQELDKIPDFLEGDKWYGEDLSTSWLDFTEPYNPPKWTLSHNGKPFANLGELHVITGKSGNGKTSFMSMLMAAILKGNYGGLRYELKDELPFPVILYVDTEQGKDDSIAIKNRICKIAGIDYTKQNDQFYYLRQREIETAQQRWRQILNAMWITRPNVVFLDGMLDIVQDYNDQVECQPLIRKLMKMATYYNSSVWCVLHENPTFEKMVGTLGSVLERKVTEAFAVRKHKNETGRDAKPGRPAIYFSVQQKKSRRYDQDDWDFEIINDTEGWGVPMELDIKETELKTQHTPEELKKWLEEKACETPWPATRTDIYKLFEKFGVTDEEEQKELVTICINRRFLIEQTKLEMKPGQKNPRLSLNSEEIIPR